MTYTNVTRYFALIVLLAGAVFLTKYQDNSLRGAPRYRLTDLGTLGGKGSSARALNQNGEVAGGSNLANGQFHGCLWSGGTIKDLGTLYGRFSRADGINDYGEVTGVSDTSEGRNHQRAFLYSKGEMTDLGTLGGNSSIGWDVDNSGRVVGASEISEGGFNEAFAYAGSKMRPLGTGSRSGARAINDRGDVVGSRVVGHTDYSHAFLWRNGETTDLGTLPGGNYSEAFGINASGTAVGWANNKKENWRAVMWRDGAIVDLGTLGGTCLATGINASDQVVGISGVGILGNAHAFLYDKGKMYDLNRLVKDRSGFTLEHASAINDKGQITCDGVRDHERRGFLLTPVQRTTFVDWMSSLSLLAG